MLDYLSSTENEILNHEEISREEFERFEVRLDEMQNSILTVNSMLRELTSLVYRQHQITVKKKLKHRRHSDTASDSMLTLTPSVNSLTNNQRLSNAASPSIPALERKLIETPIDSSAGFAGSQNESPQNLPSLQPTIGAEEDRTLEHTLPQLSKSGSIQDPKIKKLSMPMAVPDLALSSEWLSKKEGSQAFIPQARSQISSKIWLPYSARKSKISPAIKAPKLTKLGSGDRDLLSRRFSVSSIDMPSSQSLTLRQSTENLDECVEPGITPEEIMSARKLEGDVSRFTLRHDSVYRTIWDLLVIVLIILDLVFTPLTLGFRYSSVFLKYYSSLESVVFAADFFARMFSSYADEHGNLISGPKQTATNYLLSGWALPDFLSWFPFELFGNSAHSDVIGVFKIFRLAKVSHLAYRLNSAKKAGLVRFVLLLGLVLTIVHLLTCYWSWVATGWRAHVNEGNFIPQSLFDEYSLCWSLVIGCVNASPPLMYTTAEFISVACFMLIGNILQASVFGAVAALIASIDEKEAAYSKKIISTSERCRFLGISDELAKRIRGYYENLWRETKSVNADADAFINELSPALICEVKFQLYRDMLKQIPFLSAKTLAPAVIEVLVLRLRTVIYMQDDVLIRKDDFGDWMGFIGSKGTVGVLDPNSKTVRIIRILYKGEYFGEMALLQHIKRSATTVALTWVQIHVLSRQDLDYVRELYPTQAEVLASEMSKYMIKQSKITEL
ncbi:putative cyclic nucleotide-binding domain, rmlC-like jelly roll [Plasmopara halstedii]